MDIRRHSNYDKMIVMGLSNTIKHRNHRASKHAAFWSYFLRKAQSVGVIVVRLYEFRSSKACQWYCKKIEHDKKKHYRVYWCPNCERHAHRDDSSAEICMVRNHRSCGCNEYRAKKSLRGSKNNSQVLQTSNVPAKMDEKSSN